MMSKAFARYTVIPATAGIQEPDVPSLSPCSSQGQALDPRFRGGDDKE
jgi:hypothetical protein